MFETEGMQCGRENEPFSWAAPEGLTPFPPSCLYGIARPAPFGVVPPTGATAPSRRVAGTQLSEALGLCVLTTEFDDTEMMAPEHHSEDLGGQPLGLPSASGHLGGPDGATHTHDPRGRGDLRRPEAHSLMKAPTHVTTAPWS